MAHSKLARTTMFDWIERCLDAGTALPTDAQIVDRYGFASTEQARTLLADLADAGKITIRGHGEDRTIMLGRVKSVAAGMVAPIAPTIKRADPAVEAGVAKIAAIVARTKKAAPIVAKPQPITPEQPAALPLREEPMPAKTISIPASVPLAIEAVETRAKQLGEPLGIAAADLIIAGAQTLGRENSPPEPGRISSVEQLAAAMHQLFADLNAQAARPDLTSQLAAAEARADAAETKLAQAKALFA